MTKKIKSRKCVTVVVKEVVIIINIFFGWMGTFVAVLLSLFALFTLFCRYYIFSKMWLKLSALYCIIIATQLLCNKLQLY